MRLVDGVCIFVTELMDDLLDSVVVAGGEGLSDQAFELEGAALALVVQLIVERFGDVGIHDEFALVVGQLLHGGRANAIAWKRQRLTCTEARTEESSLGRVTDLTVDSMLCFLAGAGLDVNWGLGAARHSSSASCVTPAHSAELCRPRMCHLPAILPSLAAATPTSPLTWGQAKSTLGTVQFASELESECDGNGDRMQ